MVNLPFVGLCSSIITEFTVKKHILAIIIFARSVSTRGKSLLELWVTTFLPDWQPPLIFVRFTSKSHEHYLAILLEHMHKSFEINLTRIKGGCQLGRKVVTHNSKSDLLLSTLRKNCKQAISMHARPSCIVSPYKLQSAKTSSPSFSKKSTYLKKGLGIGIRCRLDNIKCRVDCINRPALRWSFWNSGESEVTLQVLFQSSDLPKTVVC